MKILSIVIFIFCIGTILQFHDFDNRFLAIQSEICRDQLIRNYYTERNKFEIYDELHKKYPDDKRIKALRHDAYVMMYFYDEKERTEWKTQSCKYQEFDYQNK